MRILFMGTPDFALETLKTLWNSEDEIIGVVTQPDKPKGRGYQLTPPPVKVFATEKGIPVYQPQTLKGEEFASLLEKIDPELIVVVAYGKILPESVLNYPKYGCINVHGSLLPKYRGAAPMQRAIINGEKQTGITTMYMAKGLDTGDMLLKDTVEICEDDNFETVHDKLALCGARTMLRTVQLLKEGKLERKVQDDSLATYAAKIEKGDCVLDFSKDARTLHNLIRGLSPMPLAFTHTPDGKLLKITAARVACEDCENKEAPGTVLSTSGGEILLSCGKGRLALLGVVPEGKGRMKASDYINGRKISVGDILD